MAIPAQATPDILSLLSLFTSKSGTTSGSQTSSTKSDISKEGMDALLRQILESDKGVASIVSGQNKTGLYNSTVNQQLLGDFLSRAAGELAVKQAGTTTTSTSSQSTSQDPTLNPGKTAGVVLAGSLLGPTIGRGLESVGVTGGIGGVGRSIADLLFGAQGGNLMVDTTGTSVGSVTLPNELRGQSGYDYTGDTNVATDVPSDQFPEEDYSWMVGGNDTGTFWGD